MISAILKLIQFLIALLVLPILCIYSIKVGFSKQHFTRHTLTEVRIWFKNKNLRIVYMEEYTDFYGITIRGIEKG